jgi:hypothetical protein
MLEMVSASCGRISGQHQYIIKSTSSIGVLSVIILQFNRMDKNAGTTKLALAKFVVLKLQTITMLQSNAVRQ